jgi:hypothetical protein
MPCGAAPPRHLKIWASGPDIFVEIPGHLGRPPYITSYPFSTRGIQLLLDLTGAHRIDTDYSLPPIDPSYAPRRPSNFDPSTGTPAQQAMAEKLLRQAGLIKP